MIFEQQLLHWINLLNEAESAQTLYKMFMLEHPNDKLPLLVEKLLTQFKSDFFDNSHVDISHIHSKFMSKFKGRTQSSYIDEQQGSFLNSFLDSLNVKYYWSRIDAQTYAAIITRNSAKLDNAKGKYINEYELSWYDVRRNVSRKTLEDCISKICHNINVLEANAVICGRIDYPSIDIQKMFIKLGFAETPLEYNDSNPYFFTQFIYNNWASYEKNGKLRSQFGNGYICDSDTGPSILKEILNSYPYSCDDDDLVVALNKCLDVVHFRGDLASAFIEGGQQTCQIVSNMPNGVVV